jgi:prepilin-type N-terminal cleavage/methylation domain-containing protein
MQKHRPQSGFSVVELAIVLAVVGLLGFVGYSVYNRSNAKTADDSTTNRAASPQSAKTNDVASAPDVSSTSDLDKASAALDQTDPGGSNTADSDQLDSQLNSF